MGGGQSYKPVPASPMPIEDSIGNRAERAAYLSRMNGTASRAANDLDEPNANKLDAVTRADVAPSATTDTSNFDRQPQPRGPRDRVSGPRPNAAGMTRGSIGSSAVLTG